MLYRFAAALIAANLLVACAAVVDAPTADDANAPMYEPELDEPQYAEGDPAPIYHEAAGAPAPVPAGKRIEPSAPDRDAGGDEPAPAPEPSDEPAPVDPTPPVPVDPTPAPAAKPTACKLASGVVLTCGNESLYQRRLSWSSYACNSVDAVQCVKGAACSAWRWDGGGTESGVCQ